MATIKVTTKTTEVSVIDIGDVAVGYLRSALAKRKDGAFDDNWTPSDFARGATEYTVDSIEVEEVES